MNALSYQTKLPFAQNRAHFIEVEHVLIVEGLDEILEPVLANFFTSKVENARFVWRQNDLNWVELKTSVRTALLRQFFDKSAL